MVVTKFLLFLLTQIAASQCNRENIVVPDDQEVITLHERDFENELCILRFATDDSDTISLVIDDISCANRFHLNINGAVRPVVRDDANCKTTINSKLNLLEVILTLHKTSLNLSQEGLRLSVSKQNARSEELIADISDTPSFSYSRDSNDTKKQDDGYIDWAVYVVVLVLIVLPIVAVLYCACKSTMPTSTSATTDAPRRTTQLNQTAKTISQQPLA